MVFGIPTLIAFASSFFTLEAGDIFMTGSPPGNGATRTPPRWLRPGETMEMRIGDLGMLVSPVEAE
jgi:2-keto-4-pentenoate hydratase/2-oxohepta-3-ene-1,7-dioic acid hydratase in catechol pathway